MPQGDMKALELRCRRAGVVAEIAKLYARPGERPSNRMTPTILAGAGEEDGGGSRPQLRSLLRRQKLKALRWGAFWGVAQGSDEPPALIVLRYDPVARWIKFISVLVGRA